MRFVCLLRFDSSGLEHCFLNLAAHWKYLGSFLNHWWLECYPRNSGLTVTGWEAWIDHQVCSVLPTLILMCSWLWKLPVSPRECLPGRVSESPRRCLLAPAGVILIQLDLEVQDFQVWDYLAMGYFVGMYTDRYIRRIRVWPSFFLIWVTFSDFHVCVFTS